MAMQIMENARRRAMSRLPQPAQAQAADAEAGTIREPRRPDMGFTDPPVPNPTPGPPQTPDYGIHRANLPTDPNSRNGGINPNPSLPNFGDIDARLRSGDYNVARGAVGDYFRAMGRSPNDANGIDYWTNSIVNGKDGKYDPNYFIMRFKDSRETGGSGSYEQGHNTGQVGQGGAPLSMILQMLASRMGGQAVSPSMGSMPMNQGPSVQTPMVDINEIVRKAMQGY